MILSSAPGWSAWLSLAAVALVGYVVATLPGQRFGRMAAVSLSVGVLAHAGMLLLDIGGSVLQGGGARLGFGPVLSLTVCLVLAVHALESRFVPLPAVRRVLACAGAVAVALAIAFPGEPHVQASAWAPVHWLLGVASYGLFGAAVLHALMLDSAERRLRLRRGGADRAAFGLPLMQLERLTFRFVQAGFAALSVAIVMGAASAARWRWDHKSVLSVLAWLVFAALLVGRQRRGWRGQQATRWVYAGALLLLLAYAGSRFVLEVVLHRAPG